MVSQQFQPLFIFIVFLFQQPKWIWIYFYVSSTFPHICFHHCCFVVFKNNIGTLLKVHWELHTHWVVATSDPVFLAIFAQATIVLWNETRGASDTMQICEVRPWVGKFGDGNCVVRHCPSPITAFVVKIFGINNSCDWRRTVPHHIITITNLTDPTQSNLEYICTILNLDQNLSSHIQNPKFLSYVNSWFFKKEYNSIPLIGNNSLAGRQSLRWCWRRWCVCPPSVTMYNKTWSRLLIERSQCWITRVRLGVEARRSARREMRW